MCACAQRVCVCVCVCVCVFRIEDRDACACVLKRWTHRVPTPRCRYGTTSRTAARRSSAPATRRPRGAACRHCLASPPPRTPGVEGQQASRGSCILLKHTIKQNDPSLPSTLNPQPSTLNPQPEPSSLFDPHGFDGSCSGLLSPEPELGRTLRPPGMLMCRSARNTSIQTPYLQIDWPIDWKLRLFNLGIHQFRKLKHVSGWSLAFHSQIAWVSAGYRGANMRSAQDSCACGQLLGCDSVVCHCGPRLKAH